MSLISNSIIKKLDISLLANYLFVAYAFFISISNSASQFIFTIILILFFIQGDFKNKLIFALHNKVIQAFLLFYLMHFLWAIFSENFTIAQYKFSNFRYIIYIAIYIVMIRSDFVYKILSGFIFGIFFSEIVSYLMFYGIRLPYIHYSGGGLNVPFMLSYTQYSIVLSISLGIILYAILSVKQHPWMKALYILFFLSSSSNIFIIESKLGYGLYALSIMTVAVIVLFHTKKYWMFPLGLLLVFLGYLFAYNLSPIFHERVNGFFGETKLAVEQSNYQTSTGARVGYYVYGHEVIIDNLFGVGTGDHVDAFIEYMKKAESNQENITAMMSSLDLSGSGNLHSEYLDISMQFGLIGLIVFLNIFYQSFIYKNEDNYMKAINILFTVILLVVSTVSLIFAYSMIGKMFTLLTALTLKLYQDTINRSCNV